jgi:outer membrane receptor protein involved in Fe transport
VAAVKVALLARPPPTGALVVRANVDGALIKVDGKESGFTPGVVEGVVAGGHSVELVSEGRERFAQKVEVVANERAFVDAHLRYAGPSVEAATKSLARASDAPGSITVITREELRAFGYQTLAEALRAVRGIYISDDRTYTYLGFRGVSPLGDFDSRVLILVDGHIVSDPWVDQAYVGREFDVDLEQVERIEVVRGGGSALYGTGAIFGVINVVYRSADDGARGDLEGGLGSLDEVHGRATASYGAGRYSVLASAAAFDALGDRIYVSPEPIDGQTLSPTNDRERAFHAELKARAGDFSLLGSFNTRRKDSPTAQFEVLFGRAESSKDNIGFVEGRYDHVFGEATAFTARAYYDGSRFVGRYPFASDTDPNTAVVSGDNGGADVVGGELRLQLPELARNTLSAGVEAQDRFHVFENSYTPGVTPITYDYGEKILSVYANDAVRLTSSLALHAGARVDDYTDSFGVAFSPRLALVGHFYEGATTKLLAARSFRAPTIYERFYADNVTQVPAPNLQPELSQNVELEHTHPITDEASITGALFYTELSQLIELLPVAGQGVLQYQNAPGTIRSYGAEVEVRYRPGPYLLLDGWYAYQHTRDDDGLALDNSPTHTGAARAMVPVIPELLNAATELIYNSARYTPPDLDGNRDLVGELLSWNLVLSGSYARYHLRWQAGVFNLLDQRVELPAVAMPPGVNVAQYGRIFRLTAGVGF